MRPLPSLLLLALLGACRSQNASPPLPDPALAPGSSAGLAASALGSSVGLAASAAPSASAAPEAPASAAAPGGLSLARRAEACFADEGCALEEAARLALRSVDAGEIDAPCARVAVGVGVARDARRARACYARSKATDVCGGSSAGLDVALRALLLIDGQGGTVDVPAARALLADCEDDVTKSALLTRASEREGGAPPPADADFCRDIGGTTLVDQSCRFLALERTELELRAFVEGLLRGRDAAGIAAARAAAKTFAGYLSAEADRASDDYRGGSLRASAELSIKADRVRDRLDLLRALASAPPPSTGGAAALKRALADVDAALARARAKAADKEARDGIAGSQKAWIAYRDAELAFLRRAFGAAQGEETVAAYGAEQLAKRRAELLRTLPEEH